MVRLRHRYIVTEIEMDGEWKIAPSTRENPKPAEKSLSEAIMKSIRTLHGLQGVGLSKAGLCAKYVNGSTKICYIRTRRSAYKLVTSALPFVKKLGINEQPMSFRTLYTGATIRHCNIFLQRYRRREIETKYGSLKSDLQRSLFEKEISNIPQIFIR